MKRFNHLDVPSHWEQYWTKYPEGYTILEALINWVGQVDSMVDNVNNWNEYLEEFVETFDEKLTPTVREMIGEMEQDGRLADIINQDIFNDLNTKIDINHEEVKTELASKANDIEVRKNAIKLELEDMSAETISAIEGGDGATFDLLSIPQDGSVTTKKTDLISGLNMYPFQRKAILSDDTLEAEKISKAIRNVKLYGANEFLDYYIERLRNSYYSTSLERYEWSIFLFDSAGNKVSQFFRVSTESSEDPELVGLKKMELDESGESGITGEIIIDWNILGEGFNVSSSTFEKTGLDIKILSTSLEEFLTEDNEDWTVS